MLNTGHDELGNSNLNAAFREECNVESVPARAVPMGNDPCAFRLKPKHVSLRDLHSEWFGLAECEDGFGGVSGRNERLMKGWRKRCNVDATQHSRHRRLIVAIAEEAKNNNKQPEEVVAEWEIMFSSCNYSAGKLVNSLQTLGKIPKCNSRGRNKQN